MSLAQNRGLTGLSEFRVFGSAALKIGPCVTRAKREERKRDGRRDKMEETREKEKKRER